MSTDLPVRREPDAWTYYDFGARSPKEKVFAAVIDQLYESIDRHGIFAQLCQQPAGRTFPVVTIPRADGQLIPEPVDPKCIGGVASFVGRVKLQEYPIAVADAIEDAETLAKLIDRHSRRVALDLAFAFLTGRSRHSVFPSFTEMMQALNLTGEHR